MIGIGIGIPFIRVSRGAAIDAQAQAHFDRVIADGGLVPSGLSGVNAFFTTIKTIYATSDITTAISVGLDAQVLGYKLGAGAGTTLGQAAQKLYSCSGASGDVAQTTAASQPLLLVHEGENYYYNTTGSHNFISSATSYNGNDFDIEFEVEIQGTSNSQRIVNLNSGGNPLSVTFSGTLNSITIEYRRPTYAAAFVSTSIAGLNTWRISRNSITGVITVLKNGIAQTVTGDQLAGVNVTAVTEIRLAGLTTENLNIQGKLYWVKFYDAEVLVKHFNPNQYNPSTSQTQWTSSTGEVWTINTGTATTGYKGVLVDRTIVQGDGVDDRLVTGAITTYQFMTRYAALVPYTMDGNGRRIIAGTGAGHLYYNFVSGSIRAFNGIDLDFNAEVVNRLQLFTANFNNLVSTALLNNANTATGATGVITSSILSIFSSSVPNNFANANLTTLIHTVSVDTSNNTAIYNYIKSINNNAF
jgi:hypothetical protein